MVSETGRSWGLQCYPALFGWWDNNSYRIRCLACVFWMFSPLDPEVSLGFALQLPMVLDSTRWLKTCVLKQGQRAQLHWKLWSFRRFQEGCVSFSPGLWWSRFKTKSHPYLWSVEDCRDWRRVKCLFQKGRYSLKKSYGTMENASMLRSWKNLFHRRYVAALDLLATQGLELSRFCADNHSCCGSIFVSPRYHALCTTTPLMLLTSLASHCLPWNQQHSWNWYIEVSNMCFISLKLSTTSSWH